ncbi:MULTISPECIES: hypothetical protein [Dyella]|uniref:Uncharacterized protein n=2 Tax=Dyella TaxID=231454 RepID=A0A4R0YY32_9GAMM|nr:MULTISPECIES: hypothetical protein [Dyella]TBR40501.1 hypothetical protein EYV96_10205 [Dyella terrae]TCI11918.1 hypothetical protein EZM97_00665 [Dyella soli]
MFTLSILLVVCFGLWLTAAVIGAVFKVTFALIGGIFSIIGAAFGLLFGGLALLLIAPIVLFSLLPVLLPLALVIGVVWLIARASRHHAPTAHTQAH